MTDFIQKNNMSLYYGLGIRIIHKQIFGAILRLDYGVDIKNPKNRGIVFGVGQYI